MRAGRLTATVIAFGLALVACGGSDEAAEPGGATTSPPPATSAPSATEPSAVDDATATTTTPATTAATTTAATTTTEPEPEPVVFDLAELPPVVTGLESTVSTGDPLELARLLGGFPIDIPVPEGSTTARFDTVVSADAGSMHHEFTYSAIAPGGTIPDVDIGLDDNGPGSLHVIETWDPIMAALRFERANSTASDPGEPGGPNSVNHVYVPTEQAATVNGLPATIGNVFVWADEDVTGAASGLDPTDPVGGYHVDVDADLDAAGPIGVPLLAAIAELVPLPDGVTLDRATVRLETRSDDAFEIDRGRTYLSISFEWTAAPGATVDGLTAFFADPAIFATDDLVAAEPSFFEEGTYELTEIAPYGDTDQRLPLLLLRRYEGTLWIEAPDDAAEPVVLSYDVTLNPGDVELAPADD